MCEGSFLPSSFGPHQKHTEFESSLRSYPINRKRRLDPDGVPAPSPHGPDFSVCDCTFTAPSHHGPRRPGRPRPGGEPCSPTSCDAPHRWAGEGTRPYVTCPDDPLASATTTDILLQF